MIGFTLSSGNYWQHTKRAVDSFIAATGLPCMVGVTPSDGNYLAKLQCPIRDGQTVVYFDSDTRWIRDCDLSQFNDREEFFAVEDSVGHPLNFRNYPECFSYHDVRLLKLDFDKYFNAGFFIFNNRHQSIFDNALANFGKLGPVQDWGDQIYLNWAAQRTPGAKLKMLGNEYNAMLGGSSGTNFDSVCKDPYMLHAAGVPTAEKQPLLDHAEHHYKVKHGRN